MSYQQSKGHSSNPTKPVADSSSTHLTPYSKTASADAPTPLEALLCNTCGGGHHKKFYEAPGFDHPDERFSLVQCEHCQLVSINPLPSEQQLSIYYNTEYYGSADQKFAGPIESWTRFTHQRLAKRILKFITQQQGEQSAPPRILDVGCGRASLLSALAELGCDCTGLERADFPEHKDKGKVKIIYGDDITRAEFDPASFDAIVIWHVLEHLRSPHETISTVRRLLKPNGLLLIGVPNFGGFQAKLFKNAWYHLDLPRHLYHFNQHSLSALLKDCGFRVKKTDTFTVDQSIFGFIQSALNRFISSHNNSLYSTLKPGLKSKGQFISMDFMLAALLFPLAVLEYLISGLLWNGSCLIYYATVNKPEN